MVVTSPSFPASSPQPSPQSLYSPLGPVTVYSILSQRFFSCHQSTVYPSLFRTLPTFISNLSLLRCTSGITLTKGTLTFNLTLPLSSLSLYSFTSTTGGKVLRPKLFLSFFRYSYLLVTQLPPPKIKIYFLQDKQVLG